MSQLPNLKGGDVLSIREQEFHHEYREYVSMHNTAVEYMKRERSLIASGGDPVEITEQRNLTALAWKTANERKAQVRDRWAELKKTYRVFNRDHRL